jgi:hypothetical protein
MRYIVSNLIPALVGLVALVIMGCNSINSETQIRSGSTPPSPDFQRWKVLMETPNGIRSLWVIKHHPTQACWIATYSSYDGSPALAPAPKEVC